MVKLKKNIVRPGSRHRDVERWDYIDGIPMCIRKSGVNRVSPPDIGWTEMDERKMIKTEESIELELNRRATKHKASIQAREERIAEFQHQLSEYQERRTELTAWEDEQIFRCLHGHGTMTGLHYFIFHFMWYTRVIPGEGEEAFRPDYRSFDDWITRALMEAQMTSTGLCVVKRRQVGWSWILVAFTLYNMLFKDTGVFFVTKDESDRKKFFKRVAFVVDRLPRFLRKEWDGNAEEWKSMKPSHRIAKIRGIDDWRRLPSPDLRCASPKNAESVEGGNMSIFIVDELGKIDNAKDVLDYGEPMLNAANGLDRAGVMITGGTVGDMDASGHVIKSIYDNPKLYDTIPLFVPGWMGTYPDKYGNEDKERALKRINEKRQACKDAGDMNKLNREKQKFPLTIEEAFSINESKKIWPVHYIMQASDLYEVKKKDFHYGRFAWGSNGTVNFLREEPFIPDGKTGLLDRTGQGQVIILEYPSEKLQNYAHPYVMGVDPVDLDLDEFREMKQKANHMLSDFAFWIHKRHAEIGGIADFPACVYFGREGDLNDAYEQSIMASIFYQNAMMNIERQKGARMFNYVTTRGFDHLVAFGAGAAQGFDTSDRVWGFNGSRRWKSHNYGVGRQWWRENHGKPLPKRFIDESLYIDEINTDLAISMMAAKSLSDELDIREAAGQSAQIIQRKRISSFHKFGNDGYLYKTNNSKHSRDLYNRIMKNRYG